MLDQRGQLLRAALGFAGLARPSYDRALHALQSWLDSWSGIGLVTVGMARQGYDLQLTRYDERGWRATFYTTGMEHSPTSATGTGWKRTPRHAVQRGRRAAPARSAARLDSFREFSDSPIPGSMGDFVANGDDKGHRPLDDLEQRHQCKPGVPGKVLSRMRLTNGCTARPCAPTFHASYDTDAPVRGLRCRGRRGIRHRASGGGHVRQRITAVWRRQDATRTIPSPRGCVGRMRRSA